jgi:hypothetical protein
VWKDRAKPMDERRAAPMDDPINVVDPQTADLRSTSSDDAEWVGGYFASGGTAPTAPR